jgi:hypothetical protein
MNAELNDLERGGRSVSAVRISLREMALDGSWTALHADTSTNRTRWKIAGPFR